MKRRDLVAGMAILPLVPWGVNTVFAQDNGASMNGDTIGTSAGDLVIHPVDHASSVLAFGDQSDLCRSGRWRRAL
ncbi:hypothetical protein N8D56_05625 [Devosia sp. A8/3-2]|nr:hypothetical protein N8D56_05625 [Devosia sp. A8/3-2]